MKELIFNKNSWHYKIANWMDYDPDYHGSDICSYTRRIGLGLLFIGLAFVLTSVLCYALVQALFGLVFSLAVGMWIVSVIGEITLIAIGTISGFIAVLFLVGWFSQKLHERRERRYAKRLTEPEGPDSFVKHAYKSWKEKYCVNIKFIENS